MILLMIFEHFQVLQTHPSGKIQRTLVQRYTAALHETQEMP
jgi:hypothetical protein